jgi:hypothetical protein
MSQSPNGHGSCGSIFHSGTCYGTILRVLKTDCASTKLHDVLVDAPRIFVVVCLLTYSVSINHCSFNQAKPKSECEARVYEALSHKNWGTSSTLMNEIARDTYDYDKCKNVSACRLWFI